MSIVSSALVVDVIVHSDIVHEFILRVDEFEDYEPGQFLQLTLDQTDASALWPESRTFSIASYNPQEKLIRLIIKKVGSYTIRIFNELVPNTICTVKYAYGDFMLPMFDEEEKIHCIAGGTGIAPFLSFLEYLTMNGKVNRLYIYYSARKESELVHFEDLKRLLPEGHLKTFTTRKTSSTSENRRMLVSDIIPNVNDFTEEHFYVCGSKGLIEKFKDELEEKGAENIYLDEWD
ncbi:Ferredoxin-NADP reductase [Reichenbachiella faecimaris]|uniref:Ferredoxin-NADP reductase n=1 Tax=Reichenbachiella faecimaris TaxID=692418 RepID=A0A1W2GCE1_REIFA|nr:FAD-dependent oxidoreductase [Reichenbachiella faecimaris]SMD34340.1 Ferredoxin-NADP reductase [Reichenbachiella faecimaris]